MNTTGNGKPGRARILDPKNNKPGFLYHQLAEIIRRQIEEGVFKPGDPIPSLNQLSRKYNINKATVRQAIAELAAAGLIYTIPAKGSFVTDGHIAFNVRKRGTFNIVWISAISDRGLTGRFYTEILDAVRDNLRNFNANLILYSVPNTSPAQIRTMIRESGIDGAIIVGPTGIEPLHSLIASGLKCVALDDRVHAPNADSIVVDNEGGGHIAVQHLLSLGHRKLAFVTGPHNWTVTRERLNGARTAALEAGLDPDSIPLIESDFSPAGGYRAFLQLIAISPRPTAVFFFNDEMASGALRALYQHTKLRVPQDISFIGFDDISWSALTHPPLTTVHVEKDAIAREAVARLTENIGRHNHVPTVTLLPTRLVVRESVVRPFSAKGEKK